LRLAGLVCIRDGVIRTRNRIYEGVFDREWVRANMPQAELQRQRRAVRLGVVRTAAIAGCLIAILTALFFYAREAEQRANARAEAEAGARAELEAMRLRLSAAEAEARASAQSEAQIRADTLTLLAITEQDTRAKEAARRLAIEERRSQANARSSTASIDLLLKHVTNQIGLVLVRFPRDLWVSKYEVTQGEFSKVMGRNPSKATGNPRLPVESVTWEDAKQFCHKLSELEKAAGSLPAGFAYDLPTQAQWETLLADATFAQAVTSQQSARTAPEAVGSQSPNNHGLHDVLGNVWEWCLDGPSSQEKALRGGAFNSQKTFRFKPLTPATVHRLAPNEKSHDVGFRCVMARTQ